MRLVYQGGPPRAILAVEGVSQWAALVQGFVDSLEGQATESYPTQAWQAVFAVNDALQQSLRTKQAVSPEGVA